MIIGIVLLVLLLVGLIWFFATYNALVGLKVRVENAWAQIDVQLKRRYDLIPNLVESVKGYMAHERQTLEAVIKARQQAIDATNLQDKMQAENFLSQTLRSLFAVSERYPDLRADQNVLKLQEELTSTENKISFARQYYNDEVTRYNTMIQVVPTCFVAQAGGFAKRDFFQIDDAAQKSAPQVKF